MPWSDPDSGTAVERHFESDDSRAADPDGSGLGTPSAFSTQAAAAARPRVVLHYHLSDTGLRASDDNAVIRPEHSDPTTLKVLLHYLAGTGCQIKIQPVIDPADVAPVDADSRQDQERRSVSRHHRCRALGHVHVRGLDLDHTRPYRFGGRQGQTSVDNLGPFTRARIEARHSASGRSDNPTRACSCGEPDTAISRSPPIAARCISAPRNSPTPSGCSAQKQTPEPPAEGGRGQEYDDRQQDELTDSQARSSGFGDRHLVLSHQARGQLVGEISPAVGGRWSRS